MGRFSWDDLRARARERRSLYVRSGESDGMTDAESAEWCLACSSSWIRDASIAIARNQIAITQSSPVSVMVLVEDMMKVVGTCYPGAAISKIPIR